MIQIRTFVRCLFVLILLAAISACGAGETDNVGPSPGAEDTEFTDDAPPVEEAVPDPVDIR